MSRYRILILVPATLSATLWAYACGDGTTAPPTPRPPRPTTVAVTPATTQLTALGATEQLSAEVRDQNGQVMAGATVTWSSSTTSIATVSGSGLVTAAGNGTVTIAASAGGASGTAAVTVTQDVSAVAVTPAAHTLVAGDMLRLAVEATDANGHPVTGAEFAWESSDDAVATVDGSGLMTGVAEGAATITATADDARGTAEITVTTSDRAALVALYQATDGQNWVSNENWLTDAPLGEWYGVRVDGQGQVAGLSLGSSNLSGPIPSELGMLTSLTTLNLSSNSLSGQIPPELSYLANLTLLDISNCGLTGPIPAELGELTNLRRLELSVNNLTGPIPPELGNLASLTELWLSLNNLTGPIPPELGNLSNLTRLILWYNNLTGPIPAQLGNLANLRELLLHDNDLTGTIPPELGNLNNLTRLTLRSNNLTGPIPAELGNLASLTELWLEENNLTGPIAPQLGNLSTLEELFLENNALTGPLPPEFGRMSSLKQLVLSNNRGMEGALPAELTNLTRLDILLTVNTDLCAPADAGFQTWLERVYKHRINPCIEDPPMAYLTQAVQSREFPVPLVAGEKALLRVFPTANQATSQGIPLVRARFFVNGRETHRQDIPGKSTPIPTEVDESSLAKSANAEIPAGVIRPGLEMVIEVDPEGALDPALGVAKRIPETGRLAVGVRSVPLFDLTLIPFVWTQTNDRSVVELIEAIATDPENHEMLEETRTLLPVGDLDVKAHEPVISSSNNGYGLRANAQAIRAMEGGTGHYMGMVPEPVTGAAGVAFIASRVSFSIPSPTTIGHEFGHNMSLFHAPCGGAGGPDPSYPHPDGSTGAWGYDFRDGGSLVNPSTGRDLMSYCSPRWISDYSFTNALRYRLFDEGSPPAAAAVAATTRSLLLWGGVGADSVPFLEPAFLVDAPAALPDSAGEHTITGRTNGGSELFSLNFTMPETADGDGSSSFALVLPVRPGWEGNLASITLTGPGGSVTLDGESNLPMTILRNPRTGQVRGILRNVPPPTQAAMDATGRAAGPGLEVLFSRGIPEGAAWRR